MTATDIPQLLQMALARHQQGQLAEAAALYQHILRLSPRQEDALHLFGVLLHQTGQNEAGRQLIGAAIEIRPDRAEFHGNLGLVLKALGRLEEAEAAFGEALRIHPDFVDALVNLGGLQLELGRVEASIGSLRRAVELDPAHGNAVMNLGNALRADGSMRAAEAAHLKASELMPLSERAYLNLATTMMDLERLEDAERALKRALALLPELIEAQNNFAFLLINRSDFDGAGRWFARAVAIQPRYAAPRSGLAEVAYYKRDMETCLGHSAAAVALAPGDPQIRVRHSMRLLAAGRLGEGWDEREWRRKVPGHVQRLGLPPIWNGEDLAGRRILVCAEEGVGDEILYAGLVPELIAAGADVILECDARLLPVLQRSFPDVLVHSYARAGDRFKMAQKYDWLPDDRPVDFAIDGGSLPRFLRRTLADFDRQRPYLKPDPARVEQVASRLAGLPTGLRVGLAWRSKNVTAFRNIHYTTLADWAPLLRDPDLQVVSMQYGKGAGEELAEARSAHGIRIAEFDDMDLTDDFDAILALAAAVDVIVCPSSTLGWVGGGLGKETFLFHPVPLFVRFGTEGFPGFPSIRSFPKDVEAPWTGTVSAIHAALRRFGD